MPWNSWSYPSAEKAPATGVAPLAILSSQPSILFVPKFGDFKDRYLFAVNNATLTIINTTTWEEHPTQPDEFSDNIVGVDLLPNGTSLIVALSNGNLARLELDDEDTFVDTDTDEEEEDEDTSTSSNSSTSSTSTRKPEPQDSRVIFASKNMTNAGASSLVADPDQEKVYIINSSAQYYSIFNLANSVLTELNLGTTSSTTSSDSSTTTSTSFTPNDIVFAQSDSSDRIIMSTSNGILLVGTPDSTSFAQVSLITSLGETAGTTTHNLTKLTLSEDHNFVFVLDDTEDVVWVYSIAGTRFVDQQSSGTSLDPIEFASDDNSSFADIAIFSDTATNTVYGYISGSGGLSVFNATSPGTSSSNKNFDLNTTTIDTEDPVDLSGTPATLETSSTSDRYIYAANGDSTISVVTDKPFVSVTALSAATLTETSSTFTVTFQTDTAGTYTVRVNPDPDGTGGTELITATTISDLNTDTTTASLDMNSFSRSAFSEGKNRVVVFVTDSGSLTGRDGKYITVDRPPGQVTITAVQFGNQKAYVTFLQLSDDDISTYTLYAEPAQNQSTPDCPGSLTFSGASAISNPVTPSSCASSSSCTGEINNLTNDTVYCVAIQATDNSSQTGTLSGFATSVTPEATVGPAEFFGETGCALQQSHKNKSQYNFAIFLFFLLPLFALKFVTRPPTPSLIFLALLFTPFFSHAQAVRIHVGQEQESTPKLFTFETRAGPWLPTDSGSRDFFGMCCHPGGELEFGMILRNRYNITVATGFFYNSGEQVGIRSGQSSGDAYKLYTIPMRVSFIYRFDFVTEQIVVPFARAGFDSVLFIESAGNTIWGNKLGLHGGAGVAFLLDRIEGLSSTVESDMGINDMYLILEGRYAYINSFKSTGLDLSGFYPFLGLMMAF